MKTYKKFLEESDLLNEVLITLGGERYPRFNNVVILAGGAGSGKGFVLDKLLGIEGNVLDVDELKGLAMSSTDLADTIKRESGVDLKQMDMSDPEDVKKVHEILSDVYGITDANERRILTSAMMAPESRKPNLIFDVTLKDMSKLEKLTRKVKEVGYESENIHVVWVLNSVAIAQEQNKNRSRVVPEEILLTTHEGVSVTMARMMDLGDDLSKYLDGDIVIAFNRKGQDTSTRERGDAMYIEDADYFTVKKQGEPVMSRDQLPDRVKDKIRRLTPDTPRWEDI